MSALIVAALVRNEASRYWRSALSAWSEFADRIVVLDDNSDDETLQVALEYEKVEARVRFGDLAWGAEGRARQELWNAAMEVARAGDVVLWLDADMVPLSDPRDFINDAHDTYYFALFDLWGELPDGRLLYRDDALWSAHHRPRAWAVRKPRGRFEAQWSGRGLHCGHLPLNWMPRRPFFAPMEYSLLHYGYFNEGDRLAKAGAYLRESEKLSDAEREHARSIVDVAPPVKILQWEPTWRLMRA